MTDTIEVLPDQAARFAAMYFHLTRRFAEEGERRKAEFKKMTSAIDRWKETSHARYVDAFGQAHMKKLNETRKELARRPLSRLERQQRGELAMRELQIDRNELHAVRSRSYEEFADILRRPLPQFGSLRTHVDRQKVNYSPYRASADGRVMFFEFAHPHPHKRHDVLAEPFLWWDRKNFAYATGEGTIVINESQLNGEKGLIGASMAGKNHDTDNEDSILMERETGVLAAFTPSKRARLEIAVDFTCQQDLHTIVPEDEWGFSDYHAWTREESIIGVMHGIADLAGEHRNPNFVAGLDGAGNDSPGSRVLVASGETKTETLTTSEVFEAGAPLLLYAGTGQLLNAALNDVSIDIAINSLWHVDKIVVKEV